MQRPLGVRRDFRSHAQRPPQVNGSSSVVPHSRGLLGGLLLLSDLVKLSSQRLADALAESLFNEAAGVAAFAANETFGLHAGLACRGNGDLDGLIQAAPPIWTVSLIEPSVSDCSVTVCPRLRASIRAFSTA